jgi:hypothetical protein
VEADTILGVDVDIDIDDDDDDGASIRINRTLLP